MATKSQTARTGEATDLESAAVSTSLNNDVHLEPRRARTVRKSIWLTEEAREAIQDWADQNQTSFSAAIETLARTGLGDPMASATTAAISSVVARTITNQVDRIAKLAVFAAVEAGISSRLSSSVLRLLVQDLLTRDPRHAEDLVVEGLDDPEANKKARGLQRRLRTAARIDSIARLRQATFDTLFSTLGSSDSKLQRMMLSTLFSAMAAPDSKLLEVALAELRAAAAENPDLRNALMASLHEDGASDAGSSKPAAKREDKPHATKA